MTQKVRKSGFVRSEPPTIENSFETFLIIEKIINKNDEIARFWGDGGWAQGEAAELLSKSRLDRPIPLSARALVRRRGWHGEAIAPFHYSLMKVRGSFRSRRFG